jgi:hypothetical protein
MSEIRDAMVSNHYLADIKQQYTVRPLESCGLPTSKRRKFMESQEKKMTLEPLSTMQTNQDTNLSRTQ